MTKTLKIIYVQQTTKSDVQQTVKFCRNREKQVFLSIIETL